MIISLYEVGKGKRRNLKSMSRKETIFWLIWFGIICPILLIIYFNYKEKTPIIYNKNINSDYDGKNNLKPDQDLVIIQNQ